MADFGLAHPTNTLTTIFEALCALLPKVEHLEAKRVLGFAAVQRSEELAEEVRALASLVPVADGDAGGAPEGAALERSILQKQIHFFAEALVTARAGGGSGGGGAAAAAPAPAAALPPVPRRPLPVFSAGASTGSRSGSSVSSSAAGAGGARELISGLLGGEAVGVAALSSSGALLRSLRTALRAEEEALLADIEFLGRCVVERGAGTDVGGLRAKKAALQKRWLEAEAEAAAAGCAMPAPAAAPALPPAAPPRRAGARMAAALRAGSDGAGGGAPRAAPPAAAAAAAPADEERFFS
jgi:hypothetical protein